METQSPLGLDISEPIVTSNQTTPETNMNEDKIYVNQNKTGHFSHTAAYKCFVFCIIIPPAFFCLGASFSYLVLSVIFGVLYFLFFYILNFYLMVFKLEINKSNNITNINVKNIFGCSRVTFNGNIHFYYYIKNDDDHNNVYFFIINDSTFNLDTENIKKKPVMLSFF